VFRLRRPRSPLHTARRAAAVLLAAVAVVLAMRPDGAPARARERPATIPVVVAGRDLAPGTVLTVDALRTARFPAALAPRGGASTLEGLAGRALAGAVRAGEPVTDVRLVGTWLTAQLSPGQVAAPVRLADLAVAALLRPGDRVDVLASVSDAARAEVVAASALVLAKTRTADGNAGGGADGNAGSGADGATGGLLLLAVDAATAARLAAASASATLTVTLSPP
jgi:Flp pilus assembly protein CpaB